MNQTFGLTSTAERHRSPKTNGVKKRHVIALLKNSAAGRKFSEDTTNSHRIERNAAKAVKPGINTWMWYLKSRLEVSNAQVETANVTMPSKTEITNKVDLFFKS